MNPPMFAIFAELKYKMNLRNPFLLLQEIVVSKISLFWAGYLCLNGLLQREIARQGEELMLQINMPRTLGQKFLLQNQRCPELEQYIFSVRAWRIRRLVMLSLGVETAISIPEEGVLRLKTNYISEQKLLPECSGQTVLRKFLPLFNRF